MGGVLGEVSIRWGEGRLEAMEAALGEEPGNNIRKTVEEICFY